MGNHVISRQQTGQNLIIGALKTRLEETPKVTSRLSDKAVQRSNSRPGAVIPYSNPHWSTIWI